MQRDDIVYVRHVLDAARKAIIFARNRTREELDSDEMLSLSLVRLLEIIGEAANSVSVGFQEKHTQIPWKKMIGLRNRLIHGYFDINLDMVWDTIAEDLPPLAADLEKIIPREETT
jgi:uncharacterized protein with HEPN domain